MAASTLIVTAAEWYLALGLAVALPFATWLVQRVEPSARGGSIMFRIAIIPGACLLWPLVLVRCLGRRAP